MSEGIYLFGTDLRLGDNPLLQLASRECDRLALVAVVDERWRGRNCFGGRRAGQRRLRWQLAQSPRSGTSTEIRDIHRDPGHPPPRSGTSTEIRDIHHRDPGHPPPRSGTSTTEIRDIHHRDPGHPPPRSGTSTISGQKSTSG